MLDVIDPWEAVQIIRGDMVALLRRDPDCPIANLLGQRLIDLYEEILTDQSVRMGA